MDMVNCIQRAIDFIEDNICDELTSEIIASHVFMSTFHFQRLFSIVCNISLGEYIRNRRLSLAGIDVESSDAKIIDIALKYGYECVMLGTTIRLIFVKNLVKSFWQAMGVRLHSNLLVILPKLLQTCFVRQLSRLSASAIIVFQRQFFVVNPFRFLL